MMKVMSTTFPLNVEYVSTVMQSYIGSPAYHAMISSPSNRGRLGPISERDFYLALYYFPRRFAVIYEKVFTQLCTALVRSEQILHGRGIISGSSLSTPLSLGTLARLTTSRVQQALGSQARATLLSELTNLAHHDYYYRWAHQLYFQSPVPSSPVTTPLPSPPVTITPVPPVTTPLPSPPVIVTPIPPVIITPSPQTITPSSPVTTPLPSPPVIVTPIPPVIITLSPQTISPVPPVTTIHPRPPVTIHLPSPPVTISPSPPSPNRSPLIPDNHYLVAHIT